MSAMVGRGAAAQPQGKWRSKLDLDMLTPTEAAGIGPMPRLGRRYLDRAEDEETDRRFSSIVWTSISL
jgi:hypothetical protein